MREIIQETDSNEELINNKVNVRILGAKRRTKMANIKANMIGKFIQVRGTVIRISNIQPYVTMMPFACETCGETIEVYTTDGKHASPKKCFTNGCRSRKFEALKGDAQTLDLQYIKYVKPIRYVMIKLN